MFNVLGALSPISTRFESDHGVAHLPSCMSQASASDLATMIRTHCAVKMIEFRKVLVAQAMRCGAWWLPEPWGRRRLHIHWGAHWNAVEQQSLCERWHPSMRPSISQDPCPLR
jgi:hypothetical protein